MAIEMRYKPRQLSEYLLQLNKWCIELQNSQNGVEMKFLKLGETWRDKVYFVAGEDLLKVSGEVKVLYTALATAIDGAVEFSNKINSTEGYEGSEIHPIEIPEFSSKILGEDLRQMYGEEIENVINLDDMEAFSRELIRYTDETEKMLAAIKRKHRDIGDDKVWVSPQYDQLAEVIDDLNRQMAVSIDNLRFSQVIVEKKHSELLAALHSNIK